MSDNPAVKICITDLIAERDELRKENKILTGLKDSLEAQLSAANDLVEQYHAEALAWHAKAEGQLPEPAITISCSLETAHRLWDMIRPRNPAPAGTRGAYANEED